MNSLNKVLLVGIVGKQPEVKDIGDKKLYKFSLATSESYKDKDNNWVSKTTWHNIISFKENLDVSKSDRLYIEGSISIGEWTDKAGVKHKNFDIIAQNITKLYSNNEVNKGTTPPSKIDSTSFSFQDDELPF